MKKPFIYLLTAGLAVSMIANTGVVNAEDDLTDVSQATVEFQPGFLTLESVSDIAFENVAIVAGNATAAPEADITADVTDLRGTHAGWSLSATLEEFTDGPATSLAGTTINLKTPKTESIVDSIINPREDIGVIEDVLLTAGSPSSLLANVEEGNGIGATKITWESGNVELNVPEDEVTLGSHSANINWVMTNSPVDSTVEPEA